MNPHATAGQIVHYTPELDHKGPIAAIVNLDAAEDGTADLTIFFPVGPEVRGCVLYSENARASHWSWMPVSEDILALREWIGDITKQFGNRIGELEKEPDLVSRVEALETMRDNAQDTE